MAGELQTLSEIVASVMALCREQRTGTLFVKSGHRLLGQIGIENGEIVFLFSLGKRGTDALPLLMSANGGGQTSFLPGQVPIKIPLPPTAEILKFMSAVPAKNKPAETAAFRSEQLSAATRTVLESTLREFIGPIAGMVCAEAFRTGGAVELVIATLAQELPTRDKAEQFRALVRQRLG